jgi:hypothetical protein
MMKAAISIADGALRGLFKIPFKTLVFSVVVATFVARVVLTPFRTVVIGDEYAYAVKAFEFLNGNFAPMLIHEPGYSLIVAAVAAVAGARSIQSIVIVSQWVSIAIETAAAIPLVLAAREMFGKAVGIIAGMLYIAWMPPDMLVAGRMECLTVLVTCVAILFAAKSRGDWRWFVASGMVCGFNVIVHPGGWTLFIAAAAIFLFTRGHKVRFDDATKFLAGLLPVVSVVVADALVRLAWFGSPFDYGPNSNYWVQTMAEAWAPNVDGSSILAYLSSTPLSGLLDRFVFHGTLYLAYDFVVDAIPAVLLAPFAAGFVLALLRKKHRGLAIALLSVIVVTIPVFGPFPEIRYTIAAIPAVLMLCAWMVNIVTKHALKFPGFTSRLATVAIISALVAGVSLPAFQNRFGGGPDSFKPSENATAMECDTYGAWCAANLHGSFIMVFDGAEIMEHFNDTGLLPSKVSMEYYAPSENVTTIPTAYFATTGDAYAWLKENRVTDVVVTNSTAYPWFSGVANDSRFTALYRGDSCVVYEVD